MTYIFQSRPIILFYLQINVEIALKKDETCLFLYVLGMSVTSLMSRKQTTIILNLEGQSIE